MVSLMPVKVQVELCALCGADLSKSRRDGLAVVVGGSTGGWGQRTNAIDFSDEVCHECYDTAMSVFKTLWSDFKKERKDANKTFVVVTDTHRTEVR